MTPEIIISNAFFGFWSVLGKYFFALWGVGFSYAFILGLYNLICKR